MTADLAPRRYALTLCRASAAHSGQSMRVKDSVATDP
jgi:hypothetical protein